MGLTWCHAMAVLYLLFLRLMVVEQCIKEQRGECIQLLRE
jgi:hypothetical protein